MPDSKFYTREAASAKADDIKLALALSKARFFNAPFVPTESSTQAELEAEETAFDGYPAGGYALAAFTGPLNDPVGGVILTSPLKTVAYGPAAVPPVTGNLGGYWIEDANGNVRSVGIYDPPRPMAAVGDGFQWVEQIVEGRNS